MSSVGPLVPCMDPGMMVWVGQPPLSLLGQPCNTRSLHVRSENGGKT